MVGINVIPGIQPPQSGVSAERARERLDFLVPYDVPGGYSYTPPQPEMNTLGLLADPNIGPQSIVAVPLGRAGVVGERTGVINPAIQEETAAQQYMREAQERRKAEPTSATTEGLKLGNAVGDNNRERSFLERMAQSGLLSTLQGMARAERMYGVGPLAAFSESALDVQAARSAAEQKQREMGLELAKERLKAGDGGADYRKALGTTQVQNLLQSAGSTFGTINTIAEINKFLGANQVSGAVASAERLATQLGNLFGLNLDTASQETVSNLADMIKASLAESRLFGRDLSKADYQILAQIIQKPGLWTSNKTLVNQYKRVAAKMSAAHARKVRSLVDIFGGGAIGQQRAQRLLSTRPAVTGNLFTEVK